MQVGFAPQALRVYIGIFFVFLGGDLFVCVFMVFSGGGLLMLFFGVCFRWVLDGLGHCDVVGIVFWVAFLCRWF